jgi:hypothetical protein
VDLDLIAPSESLSDSSGDTGSESDSEMQGLSSSDNSSASDSSDLPEPPRALPSNQICEYSESDSQVDYDETAHLADIEDDESTLGDLNDDEDSDFSDPEPDNHLDRVEVPDEVDDYGGYSGFDEELDLLDDQDALELHEIRKFVIFWRSVHAEARIQATKY